MACLISISVISSHNASKGDMDSSSSSLATTVGCGLFTGGDVEIFLLTWDQVPSPRGTMLQSVTNLLFKMLEI